MSDLSCTRAEHNGRPARVYHYKMPSEQQIGGHSEITAYFDDQTGLPVHVEVEDGNPRQRAKSTVSIAFDSAIAIQPPETAGQTPRAEMPIPPDDESPCTSIRPTRRHETAGFPALASIRCAAGSIPSCTLSPTHPGGVTCTARESLCRRSHPLAHGNAINCTPSGPARWGRRSVPSWHWRARPRRVGLSCPTFMPIPRSPRTIDTLPMKQRAAEVARQATARSVPIRNQHNALAASNSATAMPIDRCMPRMKACGSVSRSK